MASINNSVYALNDLYALQNAAQNQMNCTNDRLSLQQAAYLQNASQCNPGNALANVRPGMLIPYVGEPPQAVAALPEDKWDEVLVAKANRELQMAQARILAEQQRAFQNAYVPPTPIPTADKLNAWYRRLEARVAEIEADDAVMGNREEAKWRAEMDAFKADLN